MATSSVATTTEVEIKDVPAQDYLGRRFTTKLVTVGQDVREAFARLYSRIEEAESRPAGPPFLIASQPSGGSMEIEVGAPCTPIPPAVDGLHAGHLDGSADGPIRAFLSGESDGHDVLNALYGDVLEEPVPQRMRDLLKR